MNKPETIDISKLDKVTGGCGACAGGNCGGGGAGQTRGQAQQQPGEERRGQTGPSPMGM